MVNEKPMLTDETGNEVQCVLPLHTLWLYKNITQFPPLVPVDKNHIYYSREGLCHLNANIQPVSCCLMLLCLLVIVNAAGRLNQSFQKFPFSSFDVYFSAETVC